ncbi:MAG: SGNH/GDSL hydrolase family protein [Scytonema sp. PMC 1069.18]|nr:SGNH/GDSL hydrolase family protein [Scytonema sp. PMC 1069.18]MEC4883871.1 SGNH/GDSL hydrolase family protein [Scytonema sp. PMC 1070.18]
MRDIYLLAAGLLTGVMIPVSTVPQLSAIHAKDNAVVWNPNEDVHAHGIQKIGSSFEVSFPEASYGGLENLAEASIKPKVQQVVTRRPTSGRQLYHQRLVELKASQPTTNLDENDSLQSLLISGNKSQLTYEDWKSLLTVEAKAMSRRQGSHSLGILVGDSLSLWFPPEKLPLGRLWLNQGISGDTSGGILKRLSAFSKTKPDIIYIMAGINDLRKGTADEVILSNYRRIVHSLRKIHPEAKIFIQSILPTRLSNIPNHRIRNINYQLALIAQDEGADYLNLYQWFTDFQGNLRKELTTDGLHLSKEGYDVWQSALQQVESQQNLSNTVMNR